METSGKPLQVCSLHPGQRLSGWSSMDIFLLEAQPHLHRGCLSWPLTAQYGAILVWGLCRPMSRLSRSRCRLSHSSCTSMDKSSNLSGPQCSICKLQTVAVPTCWEYLDTQVRHVEQGLARGSCSCCCCCIRDTKDTNATLVTVPPVCACASVPSPGLGWGMCMPSCVHHGWEG